MPPRGRRGPGEEEAPGTRRPKRGADRTASRARRARHADPGRGRRGRDDEAPIEGVVISPDAYSQGEVLRHREFDRMTPAELREAERLVDLLVPRLERRRTRRYELHSHGRRLAPRAMFRRNLGTGGQLADVGLAAADPRAAVARRPVRHLGLDGAPLAAAPPVRPGALGRVGGPDRVVRVRDAADPGHAAAAGPRPRPGARPGRRYGQRLGRRDADRRVVPDVQPAVGAARRCGRPASSSSCRTAGTAATRRSSRPRPPGSGATATASSGSTRWPARPATSRSPAGCAPPTRTSTTSCRPGPSPVLERLGEILGGVRAGDTRRGSEAAAHAALPGEAAASGRRRRGRPSGVVGGDDHRPDRTEATAMKELLDTLTTWQADGAAGAASAAPSSSGRSAPRRDPRAPSCSYAADGRIAGSVSGGCVEGAAAEEIERARRDRPRPRDPLRDQRRAGVGRRARLRRHDRRPRRAGRAGRRGRGGPRRRIGAGGQGSAVITPLPADSPPGEFGPHEPGDGAPPAAEADRHATTARLSGTLGLAGARRRRSSRPPATRCARGLSRTVELGGRSLFIEVFPVRPRLVVVGGVEVARSLVRLARELGFETVVVDGRAGVRDAGAVPGRRPARRRLAGRGGRRDRARARTTRSPSCRTTSSSTSRRSSRRCAAAAATSARSGRARPRPTGGRACSRPASARPSWRGCADRSAWTSAGAPRPRRRSRSWPRSSPSGTAARGAADARTSEGRRRGLTPRQAGGAGRLPSVNDREPSARSRCRPRRSR